MGGKDYTGIMETRFYRDSRLELYIPNFELITFAVECVSALLTMHPSRKSSGYFFVSRIS